MLQRIYDALFYALALHDGREELGAEGEGRVGQLVAEVAVAGSRRATDDGDTQAEQGQVEAFLEVEDALFLELADNLLTAAGLVAKGIGGVNVADNPREAVSLVELGRDTEQHLHAGRESLARRALKMGAYQHPA